MGSINHTDVLAWIDKYEVVWRGPGTAKLDGLFTKEVTYSVSPWKKPLKGLGELERFWAKSRSDDEVFSMQSKVIAVEGQTAVAKIEVTYAGEKPAKWRDLWIITLGQDGKCSAFEEWPFSTNQV